MMQDGVKAQSMQFTQLDLQPPILQAIGKMGYDHMTPIQEQAIPVILEGYDVLGLAETGSGKTGACGIPLVQRTDPDLNAIQALILVPTRELASQYVEEVGRMAQETEVVPFAVFGGVKMSLQQAKLRHKVHILVATPGRLLDFIWNTDLNLSHVRTLVLDEADEMLNMGFIEDVEFIMSCLVHDHQTLLFSATMPKELDHLATSYLKAPRRIELNQEQRAPQSLQHHFQHTDRNRLPTLIDYLRTEPIQQSIIFCNSRHQGGQLLTALQGRFTSLAYIHGGLEQSQRALIFDRFRRQKIKFMVATDLAARGLDFRHVSHVINYDPPLSHEAYTHRTGRAGRMGRAGIAMTLVTDRDLQRLNRLLRINRIEPVWRGRVPELARRPGSQEGVNGKRASRRNTSRRWSRKAALAPKP
jgi:ATP-dependent RNA helicase DeaD